MKNSILQKRNIAFTLVEILVVIAIIALLIAILIPALSQSKKKGYQSSCQSNLRQIGIMFSMYRSDYDNVYPKGNSVHTQIITQINNKKLQCPSALITKKFPDQPAYNLDFTGYGFNIRLTTALLHE